MTDKWQPAYYIQLTLVSPKNASVGSGHFVYPFIRPRIYAPKQISHSSLWTNI